VVTKLYFLRHGKADWPYWKKPDDDRPLTAAGKKEVRAVAQLLVRLKAQPDLILTSPLPRAAQTAKIAAEKLKVKCVVEELLRPGFGLGALKKLQKKYPEKDLMVVGHENDFSQTIAGLTNGRIKLAKAGIALVEMEDADRARLRWLFPPKVATA
jgi:phosphohistidine phosphatase